MFSKSLSLVAAAAHARAELVALREDQQRREDRLAERETRLDGEQASVLWRTAADLGLPVTVILYRRNNAAGLAALLGVASC